MNRPVAAAEFLQAVDLLYPGDATAEKLRKAFLLALHNENGASQPVRPAESGSHTSPENLAILENQLNALLLQLRVSTDQYSAVSEELDELAAESPCQFSPEHLWTLVKALRIQNQILNFYLGEDKTAASQPATP